MSLHDPHRAEFMARMSAIIDALAVRSWRELSRTIHFRSRSEGQKRRHAKAREHKGLPQ